MKKLIWMAAAFVLITACQDDDKVNTKPVAAFKATAGSGTKHFVYRSVV